MVGVLAALALAGCEKTSSAPSAPSSAPLEEHPGAPATFRACLSDADCVAVARVGCCHNGWKEAVAASQAAAYAGSFACPEPHPICPMFLVRDDRVAHCDTDTRLCTMTGR